MMPDDQLPNTSEDVQNVSSQPSVTPSREQQWREIVGNPPLALPAASPVQQSTESSDVRSIGLLQEEYTRFHRWFLIATLTAMLILLGQGVAGDSGADRNVDAILQR